MGLYREFGATGGATAREDKAAFVRSHAFEETMSVAPFDFFGLISSLGHFCIVPRERGFVTA